MCNALIVEDNPIFRQSLYDALRTRFPRLRVEQAEDDRGALKRLAAAAPDLVFMDIKLPRGNGLTLTRIIKRKHPAATVIVLTSHDLPEYRLAAIRSGASHFLAKGTSSEAEILSLVESILRSLPARSVG